MLDKSFACFRKSSNSFGFIPNLDSSFPIFISISMLVILFLFFDSLSISFASFRLSTECINTSIEHFIDMVDKEIKEEIRIIKDIAAGAVWVWGIGFFASEFFWIIMAILGVLTW